ncbi:hypothetical protein EHM69_06470 [candidate division KSB1 bacterium]|nr:MAG: hypothetical protein EHM69_06470 [candidate division KSB1 bacterium]
MTSWKSEWKALALIVTAFLAAFYLPVGSLRFNSAVFEALELVKWYAREHVILCLIPAFFIAGAITVFVSKESVMRYLGPRSNKILAYGVASISGTILAVCSCTVLPIFAGITRMGAGLGPATAFLYSGPAINVLAIILTARVLGLELGVARAVGAVIFSVIIGLLMHFIFRKENRVDDAGNPDESLPEAARPLWNTSLYFFSMIAILVFANWSQSESSGFFGLVAMMKWWLTGLAALGLGWMLVSWYEFAKWHAMFVAVPVLLLVLLFPDQHLLVFGIGALLFAALASRNKGAVGEWFDSTWVFTKQILPLLLGGVLVSGFLLGRPGHEGVIPSWWISESVGGNSLWANFFASITGAFMYFATLTEVPILQGLIGAGMGKGPALALLLAGPALSLPSILVLGSIIGWKKTGVFVLLVVVMATTSGLIYGSLFG